MDTERGGGVPHPEPVFSLKRTQQKMSRNDGFINLIAQVYKDMEEKKKSQDGNILLLMKL